jgi:hypothetical protein
LYAHVIDIERVPRKKKFLTLSYDSVDLGSSEESIEHDAGFSGAHNRQYLFPKKCEEEHHHKQGDGDLTEMARSRILHSEYRLSLLVVGVIVCG